MYATQNDLIERLTDDQAIAIAQYLTNTLRDEIRVEERPNDNKDLVKALNSISKKRGEDSTLLNENDLYGKDRSLIADLSRTVLHLISNSNNPKLKSELDEWLKDPPTDETALIEGVDIFYPMLGISLMGIVFGIKYNRESGFDYDTANAGSNIQKVVDAVTSFKEKIFSSKKKKNK